MSTQAKKPRRPTAPRRIYQLHVKLAYLEPTVWRRLWVPDTLTLEKLHRVIQLVMGWRNAHLHEFSFGERRYSLPNPMWPSMDEDTQDERLFDLATVLSEDTTGFVYTYDFGDDWQHLIKVEARLEPDEKNRRPLCVDGANACPPDDVGGVPGYAGFLQAIRDPSHPEHLEMWEWHGGPFDPAAFDPNAVNAALHKLRP
ncbi:plasmid pRiA4b ORF-3 family protein [Verminephrobacter aporrectodeae subsp. tuberculatae]|uniref:plasmid pRiA4b ORF-3 family protein n=1 Tax=Verminephrobacter aporrectodeae TaxID=1110389 RepID=UPI002243938D|nr:plasmid pRiA4b ORF-3 family protein [Verminephrobacter aporrectodeae]MCW8165226.1 plasmid pRiA4b ORF-3 family protein [Verminephrobacter aporrectodeae subsp. tuberculatae]MCW8167840.1 plasmid pRiA4b ORF-3 family protein [Verminephrobacter aporrectodeae subsp. tuberculatae]